MIKFLNNIKQNIIIEDIFAVKDLWDKSIDDIEIFMNCCFVFIKI